MYGVYRVDAVTLRDAIDGAGMTVEIHNFNPVSDGLIMVLWAWDGSFDRFESELENDEHILSWGVTSELGDLHQYWVLYDYEFIDAEAVLTLCREYNSILQRSYREPKSAWEVEVITDDRDHLHAFGEAHDEFGYQADFEKILDNKNRPDGLSSHISLEHVLTGSQAELIRLAEARGYFEMPRETSLEELADELDISTSAASERLTRAQRRLLSVLH